MADLMFGLGQTKKKKETAAKVRQTKSEEWNYKGRIDQDGSFLERKEKNAQVLKYKEQQRDTKSKLKDVTQEEDGEMALRKKQFNRDQQWKETKRDQVKKNTNFDMARSLFGGGGPAPPKDDEEEDEQEYEEEEVSEEESVEEVEEESDDDNDDDDDSKNSK